MDGTNASATDKPAAWRSSPRLQRVMGIGTAAFVVSSALALVVDKAAFAIVAAIVAVVLFVAGVAAFFVGFAIAVGRSRTETILLPGLFFLAGSAPRPVQRAMLGALAIQVVASVVAALLDPVLVFGIFAPIYGLGVIVVWTATHGTFPRRMDQRPAGRTGSSTLGTDHDDPPVSADG